MSEAEGLSVYFYGVVRGDNSGPLDGVTSIDGDVPVYGIAYRDLTVVVSDAQQTRYEVSRRNVLGHEAVVSTLMERFVVLPARFGSVRKRDQIASELLETFYEQLSMNLDRVDGMVEIRLVVHWTEMKTVIAEVVAADQWLKGVRRRLAVGRASQNMRLDVGKRVEQGIATKRFSEAADIVSGLKGCVAEDGVHRNETGEETRVLDASFLVHRDHVDDFTEAVTAYDAPVDGRYLMAVGAPSAPYSFARQLESAFLRPKFRDLG